MAKAQDGRRMTAVAAAVAAMLLATPVAAKEFKLALQSDTSSLDSMRNWDALTLAITHNIYDSLLDFEQDRGFFPRLAERWEQVDPLRWRFHLRKNVTFHDGSPFSADDVIFSVERMRSPKSRGRQVLRSLKEAVKLDDHTVDLVTTEPDPVLINQFNTMTIMSKAWAERNNALEPSDFSKEESNHAVKNANGTGPFKVESWEPGVKLVLKRNTAWWGWKDYPSNVETAVLTPISSAATRVAGLLTGEVDMVSPVAVQDVERIRTNRGTKAITGHEARGVFLGLDVHRDELLYSNVKGRNPFKDLRVRQAIYHAINFDALNRVVFRGLAAPAAMVIPAGVGGFDPDRKRLPYDVRKAKALLAEAGYPDGFQVTMDCSNGREIGDKDSCEAMVTMLAQIGIKVDLELAPSAKWYAKVVNLDTSLYRMSWGNNGWAGGNTLNDILGCEQAKKGGFNMGGYCNRELDALTALIRVETNPAASRQLLKQAFDIVDRDLPYVPLHYPPIIWGAKQSVSVKLRTDGRVWLPHVVIAD